VSRWLYQMSERGWASANYRAAVREGKTLRWPTYKVMFSSDDPAAGDLMILTYAETKASAPGICGLGLILKYLPRSRRFDWLVLPPTNSLKANPWWDNRAIEIVDAVRKEQPQATMYFLSAALETDLRRGLFAWAR
jgi:hypothetical protein